MTQRTSQKSYHLSQSQHGLSKSRAWSVSQFCRKESNWPINWGWGKMHWPTSWGKMQWETFANGCTWASLTVQSRTGLLKNDQLSSEVLNCNRWNMKCKRSKKMMMSQEAKRASQNCIASATLNRSCKSRNSCQSNKYSSLRKKGPCIMTTKNIRKV